MEDVFGSEGVRGAAEALTYVLSFTEGDLVDGLVPLEFMPKEYRAPMGRSGRCGSQCGRGHPVSWAVGVEVLVRPAAWTQGRVEMLPRTVQNRGTAEPAPVVGYWAAADATLQTWRVTEMPLVVPCWREEDMAGQLRLRALDGTALADVADNSPVVLALSLAWSS